MKKIAIFVTAIAILQMICLSMWAAEQVAAKPFTISSKSAHTMELQFKIPEFEIEKELESGKVWDRIKIKDAGYLDEIGLPELPTISTSIAIPTHGSVEVELVSTRSKMINHIIPYPSQDGNIDGTPKAFRVNEAFYRSSESYPQDVILHSDPQILRDFRIITVQVQPFAWNPMTKELEVREEIDIRLRFTDEPGINELDGPQVISPSFAKIYESMILNFDDYRGALMANTPPRYLMIYGAYTDATFQAKINEFAFWKKQKGADVRLISTAVTGNTTTAIKAYIQNIYNDINARPDFIVLIGDTTGSFSVPTWPESFSSYNGKGDYPYQHLAGNDYLGDVFLGRISAENTSQLDNLLAKIYAYEKNINVNTAQWLNRMLLVGDTSPSGQSTVYTNKYIKDVGLHYNPDYTFTELYSGDPSPASMNTAINQGVGFFNYRGYISMSGWSPGSSLVNGTKLPHAMILTCSTGNFDGTTATSEAFIRLGTASVPAGAITATGMYTSGTHTMHNNALAIGAFNGIFTHGMRTMGEAVLNAKLVLHEIYNQTRPNQVKYFAHWMNLMGDPTVEVYCKIPDTFISSVPTNLPLGTSYLDMVITNQHSAPVKDACVTISQGNLIMARGYTDETGRVFLFLNTLLSAGSAQVTVSKHDFKPLQTTITVDATGSLVGATNMIDDDNVGDSIGNGNYAANSGETLEVLFSVRNTTSAMINNVTGYATCNSPYVNIINNALNFTSIDAGASNYSLTPVLMEISPTCPHNTIIRFDLYLTDANDSTYVVPTYIYVSDAFMIFVSSQILDGGNQVLDPGETADFTITVKNNGTIPANDLYGQLITLNDLVNVVDNMGYFGTIQVGTQVTSVADMFQLTGRPQMLPGMLIPMRLRLFNDLGFQQWVDFTLTVGNVSSTDPLGPDAYGYVIYDETDTSYEDCPTYNWIGIAPAEGGSGTLIPITDTGSTSNEGDLVGAATTSVVDLPFPFIFYGETYNQITVCSNGFIVMGITENANYRNFRLPASAPGGGGAPSPLIAPFWDDLITTGGGIYKWYDPINHLFIIEWYNCKNGKVQTAVETFQIILYDPAYYPTSLGDGPIKIQYHTFNNVDTGGTTNMYSGNYCTIGIQNYDQTIGLEYSFNNTYPTAAAPITHGKALYITTAPVYHYTPHLYYESAYVLDNNNNVIEPGETVDMYVNLQNIGEQTAQNISTTISSSSPYVTLLNSVSGYPDIDGDEIAANLVPFTMNISPDCPDKQLLPFVIQITTDTNFWQRTFNLTVEKPSLSFSSYLVNDEAGNNNGVADPGENITLVVNVLNNSLVEAQNLAGILTSTSSDVIINTPSYQYAIAYPDEILQFRYQVSVNSATSPGVYIPFNFNLTSSNAPNINQNFFLPCGTGGTILDFESFDGNFTSTAGWVHGTPEQTTPHSGSNLWATGLSGQYENNAMYILSTPTINLGPDPVMTFWHMLSCQNYYDGGNVSISTDGGSMWSVLYPVGGYNTTLNVYSLGEVGYTNTVSWSQATFNLNNYAGQDVVIRWRFGSNASVQGLGWFIDDVMISGYYFSPGKVSGNVNLGSELSPSLVRLSTNNKITTNPDAAGDYALFLPQGTYSLSAKLDYHIPQFTPEFEISNQQFSHFYDFNLDYLSNPSGLALSGAYGDSLVFLTWIAPEPGTYPVQAYNVYRRFNDHPFIMIGTSAATSFSEELETAGMYYYYVRAVYSEGEGAPTEIVEVQFPFVSAGDNSIPVLINELRANYPNPFNPTTSISFSLAKAGQATLKIYNTKGQLVRILLSGAKSSGSHTVVWNGLNNEGKAVSSGLYFYRLDAPGFTKTRKMMLLK